MQTWQRDQQHPLLRQAHQQWLAYLKGELKQFDLPLHFLWGTPFQQSVWTALLTIPYGQTTSYADIAHAVGRPSAFRAVGAAVGRNPLSVIVPCHRVMGANGALTGYAGGLQRKQHLLQLEAQHA
jgi:methylated-DNA-[protein]-cysteine S-methyltransferase